MPWLLALIGAFFGALAGSASSTFAGFIGGALLGWQQGRIGELRRRVEALEGRESSVPQRAPAAPAAAVRAETETAPAPAAPAPGTAPAQALQDPRHPGPDFREPAAARAAESAPPASGTAKTPSPPPRPAPRVPAPPNPAERAITSAWGWFSGGNVPVKIGLLVLLFGIGAALKYAVGQGWVRFPLELKLAAVAAVGVAALVWGWRNREARPAFGLSLQGGGIGILLLTTFAAYRLAHVLPAGAAFALVVLLVAGAALLAVLQDAPWLAFIGFLGGYLAPVLLSTGSGSHVALFSYYAVLNFALFAIAWKKHWRALNLLGFFFTFGVGLAWGAKFYAPEFFASVEPFLILFFAFFFAIPVLHAVREDAHENRLVDATLVFGTPLLAFPLQAALLQGQRFALAVSALVVALLYAAFGRWLIRRSESLLLGQSFALLALGFGTLAVPLAFSAQTTSAVWALEGAAAVWLGLRQRRWAPQLAGVALQFLAAFAYFASLFDHGWDKRPGEWPILNGHALSVLLLALAAFAVSWLYERANLLHQAIGRRALVWLPFLAGDAWWTLGGVRELAEHFDGFGSGKPDPLYFAAITLAISGLLRGALRWPRLGWNAVAGLSLILPFALLMENLHELRALDAPQAFGWIALFAAGAFALWRLRDPVQRGISIAHVAWLASLALVYGIALNGAASATHLVDGQYQAGAGLGRDWIFLALFLPLIVLVWLTARWPKLGALPLAGLFPRYALRWFVPAAFVLGIAALLSLALPGDVAPLPFVPIVNPSELAQIAALLIAVGWLRKQPNAGALPIAVAAAGAFVVLSLATLRAVHHYAHLPWSPELLDTGVAQTALTVLWAVAGVAAWIAGSRRASRALWMAGAALLGLVLVKLVLIDRQYMGNVAGIVSFLAVGGLLVLVGRIAPTPPKRVSQEHA